MDFAIESSAMTKTPRPLNELRILYFGTYRAEYSRNRIMLEGLRRAGVQVSECHASLWHGVEDRVQAASGGWWKPAFIGRWLRAYGQLLQRYFQAGDYDVLVVGYPGQADVFLARLLSWLRGKPLAWDVFMSIYLIAVERGLQARSPLSIRLLRGLEWLACRLPERLILDTEEYVAWFGRVHGVAPARFRLVPTGADDRLFQPHPPASRTDGIFRVLYYGTFIPNHGVSAIIEAARCLADQNGIQFELIGEGPDRPAAQRLSAEYGLTHLSFHGWMEQQELIEHAARADVCLGAFGLTPQSVMTVQNKIYEGLAMARPVLTGDSPAVRAVLQHGEHVYLCRRADGAALAQAILDLYHDPDLCRRLAEQGHRRFIEQFDLEHNGRLYATHLQELAG